MRALFLRGIKILHVVCVRGTGSREGRLFLIGYFVFSWVAVFMRFLVPFFLLLATLCSDGLVLARFVEAIEDLKGKVVSKSADPNPEKNGMAAATYVA